MVLASKIRRELQMRMRKSDRSQLCKMASQCGSQSVSQCSKTPATPVAKRNTWTTTEEKEFLLICKERAIADELDNCVTGAGVSYFCCHFCLHLAFILSQLVQMKSGKVLTVKLMYSLLLLI